MGIFRRSRPVTNPAPAIAAFWSWWAAGGAAQTGLALAGGHPEIVAEQITDRVAAIHRDLAWTLASGAASQHLLVVTAAGNPELRAAARRWLRKAPGPDRTWEYADLRQPVADLDAVTLTLADTQIRLADVVVAARRNGRRLDVTLHHPGFVLLPEQVRLQIGFLALDAALGEADTELWVGQTGCPEVAPLDAFSLAALRVAVRDTKAASLDEHGKPTWAVLSGETGDGPVLAVAQVPLSPLLSPELDQHVAVVVPYADRTPEGFPGPGSLDDLRRLEDHLGERLGGSGRLVAHQSSAGKRVLHAYVDSTTPAAEQVRAAVSGWPQGRVTVKVARDPSWAAVSHLRT